MGLDNRFYLKYLDIKEKKELSKKEKGDLSLNKIKKGCFEKLKDKIPTQSGKYFEGSEWDFDLMIEALELGGEYDLELLKFEENQREDLWDSIELNNPLKNEFNEFHKKLINDVLKTKKSYQRLKRKIIKNNFKKIEFSKNEIKLLEKALDSAAKYEFTINYIEEALEKVFVLTQLKRFVDAIFMKHGRTEKAARLVARLVNSPRKTIPWKAIAQTLNRLRKKSESGKPFVFMGEKYKNSLTRDQIIDLVCKKHKDFAQSKESLIKGLRRLDEKNLPTHYKFK